MSAPETAPPTSPGVGGARSGGAPARPRPLGEFVFAGGALLIGAFVLLGAASIRVPAGSSNVLGPRVFPYAVGALLVAAAIAVLVQVFRGRLGEADEGEDIDADARTDWLTVVKISVLFLSLMVLIEPAGWPIAVTVLFAGAALSLGAGRWWSAALIGLGLGLVTQFAFGGLLGLSLPAGPLFSWIGFLNG